MSGTQTSGSNGAAGKADAAAAATILGSAPVKDAGAADAKNKDSGAADGASKKDGTNAAGAADGAGSKAQDGQKPDDAKAAEGKPDDAAGADIEVKLPDGVQADAGFLDAFKAVAKESGLKSEGAQKLVDFYAKQQAAAQKAADEGFAKALKEMETEASTDEEIGGAKWDESKALALKAIAKFGTPKLAGVLNQSGLGNHPELLRFCARVGKGLAEDSVAGAASGEEPSKGEDPFLKLYDHPTSKS